MTIRGEIAGLVRRPADVEEFLRRAGAEDVRLDDPNWSSGAAPASGDLLGSLVGLLGLARGRRCRDGDFGNGSRPCGTLPGNVVLPKTPL